jgi:hypothetical protein
MNRRMTPVEVIEVLADLFVVRGAPEHIRSDNGPEFIAGAMPLAKRDALTRRPCQLPLILS